MPQILSGKLKPNLGKYSNPPDWSDILQYFRGSELQNYLNKIIDDDLKAMTKPQYVDSIPRAIHGQVFPLSLSLHPVGGQDSSGQEQAWQPR